MSVICFSKQPDLLSHSWSITHDQTKPKWICLKPSAELYARPLFHNPLHFYYAFRYHISRQHIWLICCVIREDTLTFRGSVDTEVMLKCYQCVGEFEKSWKKTHFFLIPHLLARSQHGEQNVCSALAIGPVEPLLYREPELIKHVSTDLTEGMRAC